MKYRDAHTIDEIRAHDTNIINKSMQIYAIDYFLFVYKNLSEVEDKQSIIFSGLKTTPALISDALEDDMLKKVVYSLCGKDIRKRMINDYYNYKKVFISVDNTNITNEKNSEIVEALRIYCLSLIDISLEYGIMIFEKSLLEPYGPKADFSEIKKQIENV